MNVIESILLAASLCADCLAVSLCSGVTLGKITFRQVARVSLAFAVIQTGLLVAGWAFGNFFAGFVDKVAHFIGAGLLFYVGGSMFMEGLKGESEVRDLNGWKNVILGGIATSIDALAIGVSRSMTGCGRQEILQLSVCLFAVTALSVVCGLLFGRKLGCRFGCRAEIVGGCVLLGFAVAILLGALI